MADGRNRPNRPIRPRGGPGGRKRRVVIEGGGHIVLARDPVKVNLLIREFAGALAAGRRP